MSELHEYTDEFFEHIERGSIISARKFSSFLAPLLDVKSVVDVGCGRGAWAREWKNAGVSVAQGVDGPYIREQSLLIPVEDFIPVDLSRKFDLGRRYDLVICLEVAEHLPRACAETFISSLVAHADLVLFSAASPGQGGENHINEQPVSFWQAIFKSQGFDAYDVLRPVFRADKSVAPWFRFNSILYASERLASSLPAPVTSAKASGPLRNTGDIGWQARKSLLRLLPNATVTRLSKWNYRRINRAHNRRKAG